MLLPFKIPISRSTKPLWFPVPWGSCHPHSYAKQVLPSESHFSSLREWCQQCCELERPVSSSVPWHPARGTFLPALLSMDHGPVGSCPICLHHLHHCSGLLSYYLPALLGFCLQPPCRCAKLSCSAHQPPSTSHELCAPCCPHPTKNQWQLL